MKKESSEQLGFDFDNNEIQSIEDIKTKSKEEKKKEELEKKEQQRIQEEQKKKLEKARKQLKDDCKILMDYLDDKYNLDKTEINEISGSDNGEEDELEDEEDEE